MEKNYDEYIGRKYGKLTILKIYKYGEIHPRKRHCLCRCECGTEKAVILNHVIKGNIRSCGCLMHQRGPRKKYDLIGFKNGKLTVVSKAKPYKGKRGYDKQMWHCVCECGNEVDVLQDHLISHDTKSCGCLQREACSKKFFRDLTGLKFGSWTVLKRLPNRYKDNVYYLCQCDCGTIKEVPGGRLRPGKSISCGCSRLTGPTKNIFNTLKSNNINTSLEKQFDDCRASSGMPYRFDYAIYSDKEMQHLLFLIEYNDRSHYYNSKYSMAVKNRDKEKIKYCEDHGIKLYIITYQEDETERVKEILKENNLLQVNSVPS